MIAYSEKIKEKAHYDFLHKNDDNCKRIHC